MHTSLPYNCPHCREVNPAFGQQRCVQCGVNMMSDQEFQVREKTIRPLAENLEENLLFLKAGENAQSRVPYIRSLVAQLEPYLDREGFSFLAPMVTEGKEVMASNPEPLKAPDQTLLLNIFILIILIMGPVVVWIGLDTSPVVIGLLCLPVLGWFYIGIYAYLRRNV